MIWHMNLSLIQYLMAIIPSVEMDKSMSKKMDIVDQMFNP